MARAHTSQPKTDEGSNYDDRIPLELTLAELTNFSLAMIYLIMLALVMKRHWHDLD